MLIFLPSMLSLDRWLKHGVRCAMALLALVLLIMILFYILYPWQTDGDISHGIRSTQNRAKTYFPYETIGTGGLALHPRHALGWISRLADELSLLAYNSRPDANSIHASILIALRNGKEQLTAVSGNVLHLKESEQGKGLHRADEATNLWVKPILLENGAVLVEAGRKLGQGGEELGQFMLAEQGGIAAQHKCSQFDCIKDLKMATSFAQDVLIQKYGGKEYANLRDKAIIEIEKGGETYALFLAPGDYLQYENNEWGLCSLENLQRNLPIAHVKSANGKAINIQVWDELGFFPVQIQIEMQKTSPIAMKPEVTPSNIRLRSGTQVSCAFGKRRMIIKQGDWLLKTNAGWRNLRKAEEIENYLQHRIRGELFIFDAIETEQGRSILRGHFFDVTRTQVQTVAVPIDADKSQGKMTRKRKPFKYARAA